MINHSIQKIYPPHLLFVVAGSLLGKTIVTISNPELIFCTLYKSNNSMQEKNQIIFRYFYYCAVLWIIKYIMARGWYWFFAHYTTSLSSLCRRIWTYWTSYMLQTSNDFDIIFIFRTSKHTYLCSDDQVQWLCELVLPSRNTYGSTHLPLVPHIFVSEWGRHCSDNGLSPIWRQAIIQTNAGSLSVGPLGKKLQWIFKQNTKLFIFIDKDASENIVCEMAAICPGAMS